MNMRLVTFIFMLLFSASAMGFDLYCTDEFSIRVGGWSKHHVNSMRGDDLHWNEDHEVVGFSCNRFGYMKFDNSWGKEAYAISFETEPKHLWGGFTYNWYAGVWSGYDEVSPVDVIPVIVPRVEYRKGPVAIESLVAYGIVTTLSIRFYFPD